jgi:hypothetical protein
MKHVWNPENESPEAKKANEEAAKKRKKREELEAVQKAMVKLRKRYRNIKSPNNQN